MLTAILLLHALSCATPEPPKSDEGTVTAHGSTQTARAIKKAKQGTPKTLSVFLPGGLTLAAGVVTAAVSMTGAVVSFVVLGIVAARDFNTDTMVLELEDELKWDDENVSPWPFLWKYGTWGAVASFFLSAFALILLGAGGGLLAGGLVVQE